MKVGLATINGISIAPKEKTMEIGRQLIQWWVDQAEKVINHAIAAAALQRRRDVSQLDNHVAVTGAALAVSARARITRPVTTEPKEANQT